MKFFEAKDFDKLFRIAPSMRQETAARIANEKLEKDTKIVYSLNSGKWAGNWSEKIDDILYTKPDSRALLINIESLEKCKHPKDEVYFSKELTYDYICGKCGMAVQPETFK